MHNANVTPAFLAHIMGNSLTVSIIAGLIVGVAFVVLFSSFLGLSSTGLTAQSGHMVTSEEVPLDGMSLGVVIEDSGDTDTANS